LCAALDEQEFLAQSEAEVCDLYQECLGATCASDQFFDTSECTYDARAAQDCVDGLAALTCDAFLALQLPSACDDVWECPPCDDDPLFEDMDDVSEGLTGDRDAFCRIVDTNLSVAPTVAGNPDWGEWLGGGDHTEFHGVYAYVGVLDEAALESVDGLYPCGPGVNARTLCESSQDTLPSGEYILIGHVLQGDVPPEDPSQYYQYGFVFDSDGDPTNNFVAAAPFTGDFFQGTDRWYAVAYAPGSGWALSVLGVDGVTAQPVASAARVVVTGNTMTLVVPKDELPADPLGYRVTVHCHQGDFGESLPATADTEAPIDQPLRTVEAGAGSGGTGGSGAQGGGGNGATGGEGIDNPSADDSGAGCNCEVSTQTMESSATLALLVLTILLAQQARRRRLLP
jgi:hypothetical protein